jgi:WD40-like Beta Propeller Repeat
MRIGFWRAATMLWCASCTGDPPRSSPIVGAEAGSLDAGSLDAGGAGLDAAKPDGAPNPGDAGLACDRTKDFGAPTVLVDIRNNKSHTSLDIFRDELVVTEGYVDTSSTPYLALSTRVNPSSNWKLPTGVPSSTPGAPLTGSDPAFSADGMTMYFASKSLGPSGLAAIFRVSRASPDMPFAEAPIEEGSPINLASSSSGRPRVRSYLGAYDELCLARTPTNGVPRIECVQRKPGAKMWFAPTTPTFEPASERRFESCPVTSADGKTLYFCTSATNTDNQDIWMARRERVDKPWSAPVPLKGVNADGSIEQPVWISDDECTLYFTSTRALDGAQVSVDPYNIFVARRPR